MCLQSDPGNRPSATQLISHQFFKQCRKTDETLVDILKVVTPIHQRKIEYAGTLEKKTCLIFKYYSQMQKKLTLFCFNRRSTNDNFNGASLQPEFRDLPMGF